MVTIIFSHPWHGSFNKVILDTVVNKLEKSQKAYQVIDLHKDNFNPVLTESELALYSKGEHKDPLVGKYQEMLKNSKEVVFIYPMWWMETPAILKGFFDKVMLYNFAFNYENGWTPLLDIPKSTVITTAEQPTSNFINCGDPVNDFISNSLASTGIKNTTWFNCGKITSPDSTDRKDFLQIIENHF